MKPQNRPRNPKFSSGPCPKRPGWKADALDTTALGRSHRSTLCKSILKAAIDRTRQVLEVPDNHRIAIVPASDTGAVEVAMWNLIGERPVDVMAWEAFGRGWWTDISTELRPEDARFLEADYGELPDINAADAAHDIIFTWNGTTSGVRVPNGDFIADDREGLTICDATSAAFAMELPWDKLDAVTYSWQKVLGGEAAHGMLILGPRAVERLESYTPPWPLPKIFRLKKNGRLNEAIFEGSTINTPSMLCVVDYLGALDWVAAEGGLRAAIRRSEESLSAIADWVGRTEWVDLLATDPAIRSSTSVCLKIADPDFAALDEAGQRAFVKAMTDMLEEEKAAFDIGAYRAAPPGLRLWAGVTVERQNLIDLFPWLDWAFHEARDAVFQAKRAHG